MNLLKQLALGLLGLLAVCLLVWGWNHDLPRWSEVWALLSSPRLLSETDRYILLELRLPRICLACLAGAGLAGAGLALQGLFRNPLVDPFVIGVSGGAALGAGLALILNWQFQFWGLSTVPLAAFAGALGIMVLVYRLGQVRGRVVIERLLLAGVAISALSSSILSLVLVLKGQGMEAVVYWIMGSFAGRTWEDCLALLPFLGVGILLLLRELKALNALQVGEESAAYLGIEVDQLKNRVILAATLLSAAVVSVSGVIGFVGLIVPHIGRFVCRTSNFRQIFIPTLFLGAALLVLADGLARNLLASQEIPVGIFTALLGVPFFLGLLLKQEF
ncbi:iron ABC transporter [bacterium (Candidatus Blackallbacteria) CG17_big_fil_post_rev_8_21_14_2_50_48_46]|uniref:Iron ABC transporter n=1 Tax=bacterium (Candidatus Blackallbacteria) CG17_big_fil_post_rev_8_21_14_2_50_48_46 TaxID=2014261 RepID=A0A2M7G010_9BACT|nr:MAG: iron ABC transporter [bacterium (Candidatus Blackallbacteria) CG18_big_fil_WC_8_21_14_2_50_49_26]PIW14519.1 MAG: iron ABC transporter [bacterium (Candidatus Blackallbacteria) CG17_big_fil_post_rev_8_21_14_2_50_48_46]PIW47204.1 MAG: iron ABC transporter [bacterium (Candidatus Blackallbacteria) CG13_big_fil_rev_8_21_14_2_50_49_14]